MSNRRMNLSGEGKEILDDMIEILDLDRPLAIKVALAKGLVSSEKTQLKEFSGAKSKWTIPDNIIKGSDFLLFNHLIVEDLGRSINEEELNRYMLFYIETGLIEVEKLIKNKTTMEDIRIAIL